MNLESESFDFKNTKQNQMQKYIEQNNNLFQRSKDNDNSVLRDLDLSTSQSQKITQYSILFTKQKSSSIPIQNISFRANDQNPQVVDNFILFPTQNNKNPLFATFARGTVNILGIEEQIQTYFQGEGVISSHLKSNSVVFKEKQSQQQISPISYLESNEQSNIQHDQDDNLTVYRSKTMEAEAYMNLKQNEYQMVKLKISHDTITIGNTQLELREISKIKLQPPVNEADKYTTLKLTTKRFGEELRLSFRTRSKYSRFPLSYFTFAKIVIKKLKGFGILNVTNWNIPQVVPVICKKSSFHLKSTSDIDNYNEGEFLATNFHVKSLSNILVTKVTDYICGNIYKKSYYLKKWQKRYIAVNELGIFSFQNETRKYPSVTILKSSIKCIWTWFSIITAGHADDDEISHNQEHSALKIREYNQKEILASGSKLFDRNKFLIVNIKHGFGGQTELSIPISNFDSDQTSKNWLYSIFLLLISPPKTNK